MDNLKRLEPATILSKDVNKRATTLSQPRSLELKKKIDPQKIREILSLLLKTSQEQVTAKVVPVNNKEQSFAKAKAAYENYLSKSRYKAIFPSITELAKWSIADIIELSDALKSGQKIQATEQDVLDHLSGRKPKTFEEELQIIKERHEQERSKIIGQWAQAASLYLNNIAIESDERSIDERLAYLIMSISPDDLFAELIGGLDIKDIQLESGASILNSRLESVFSSAACHKDANDILNLLSETPAYSGIFERHGDIDEKINKVKGLLEDARNKADNGQIWVLTIYAGKIRLKYLVADNIIYKYPVDNELDYSTDTFKKHLKQKIEDNKIAKDIVDGTANCCGAIEWKLEKNSGVLRRPSEMVAEFTDEDLQQVAVRESIIDAIRIAVDKNKNTAQLLTMEYSPKDDNGKAKEAKFIVKGNKISEALEILDKSYGYGNNLKNEFDGYLDSFLSKLTVFEFKYGGGTTRSSISWQVKPINYTTLEEDAETLTKTIKEEIDKMNGVQEAKGNPKVLKLTNAENHSVVLLIENDHYYKYETVAGQDSTKIVYSNSINSEAKAKNIDTLKEEIKSIMGSKPESVLNFEWSLHEATSSSKMKNRVRGQIGKNITAITAGMSIENSRAGELIHIYSPLITNEVMIYDLNSEKSYNNWEIKESLSYRVKYENKWVKAKFIETEVLSTTSYRVFIVEEVSDNLANVKDNKESGENSIIELANFFRHIDFTEFLHETGVNLTGKKFKKIIVTEDKFENAAITRKVKWELL